MLEQRLITRCHARLRGTHLATRPLFYDRARADARGIRGVESLYHQAREEACACLQAPAREKRLEGNILGQIRASHRTLCFSKRFDAPGPAIFAVARDTYRVERR